MEDLKNKKRGIEERIADYRILINLLKSEVTRIERKIYAIYLKDKKENKE
jgi:hypothetical protein